tara:strand:- start:6102 stop:10247 length:4146 start_codon:yes stop_codon:yes gene_type:complete
MTQVWPSTEDFLVNDLVGYRFPDRYLGITVSNSSGTSPNGHFTGSGFDKNFYSIPGVLHARGSLDAPVSPGFQFEACFQEHDGQFDSTPGDPRDVRLFSCVDRQLWANDAQVKANFAMYDSGSANARSLEGYFVYGRVRLGTLGVATSPGFTDTPRYYIKEPQGIFFGHMRDEGELADWFVLGKFSAGAPTVSYSVRVENSGAVLDGAVSSVQPFNHFKPRSLRMVCQGTRVRCYAEIGPALVRPYQNADPVLVGSTGGGVQVKGEVLIFDEDDALFTDAPGRWGFGTQGFVVGSNYQSYMTVKSFEVSTLTPLNLFIRDEFRRPFHRLGYRVPAHATYPQFQPGGNSLQQAWTGDEHGSGMGTNPSNDPNEFSSHHSHLLGDQTNDYVVLGADPFTHTSYSTDEDQNYGWYLRQDMVSDPQQRAKATFTIDAATQYELGVVLRYTPKYIPSAGNLAVLRSRLQTAGGLPDGTVVDFAHNAYVASIVKDGVDTRIQIQRFNDGETGSGEDAPVIAQTAAITAPTSGVPFEIDFECQNINQGQGDFVAMRVALDSVNQTFVVAEGSAGIGVEFVDGYVTDISSNAVLDGIGIGVKYEHAGSSYLANAVRWNSFSVDAPSLPGDPPDQDQLSIPLDAEDTNKSGSLVTPLSWSITEEYCDVDRRMRTQTGFMNSGPQLSTRRRRWNIKLSGGTYEETDAFHRIYRSNYAGSIPFDWTREDTGETVTVRFLNASLPYKHVHTAEGTGVGDVTATIEEVLGTQLFNPQAGPPANNLVLFMMDDVPRSMIPYYDAENRWPGVADNFPYPNMAHLDGDVLGRAMRFTQARVNARCAPTRAAIFTGRQGHRTPLHTYGTGIGDVLGNTPNPATYPQQDPFYEGIKSGQNPWPKIATDSGVQHGIAMFGKYHLFDYSGPGGGSGALSNRNSPRDIVDEAGFTESHEALLTNTSGDPGEPDYGYFSYPYIYTTQSDQTTYFAGDDLPEGNIFSPALMYKKITYFINECVSAGKPFVVDFETNLPHGLWPQLAQNHLLVDPANPSGRSVQLHSTYTQAELVENARGTNGETDEGGWNASGTSYEDDNGGAPYVFVDRDSEPYLSYPYGPEGQVHTPFRRFVAMMEAVDTLTKEIENYIQVNHPDAYALTTFMHYADNGGDKSVLEPMTTTEFRGLGSGFPLDPWYNSFPPTSDGTTGGTQYHIADDAKGSTKDEGILTPLLVWGPLIPTALRGTDCDRYIDAMDFYPTILDIISPNWRDFVTTDDYAKIDGVSFYDAFGTGSSAGKAITSHCVFQPGYIHTVTTEYYEYDMSVVGSSESGAAEGYKVRRIYAKNYPNGPVTQGQAYEMYDLSVDPGETNNIAASGVQADIDARVILLDYHQSFFGQPKVNV